MSCNSCNQNRNCNCNCEVVKSGDCDGLGNLITKKVDNHIGASNMLDICSKTFLKDFFDWTVNHAWNVACVLKNLKSQICSIWDTMKCIDAKNRVSVQTIDLWDGDENIFDLPQITVSKNLSNFDYLDLHILLGTERQVVRVTLAGGLSGIPTVVAMDKVGRNTNYGMGDGAIAGKEIGLRFPSQTLVKIDHFIWAITGCYPSSLNVVEPAKFITFSNTSETKQYNDSQDTANDRPHKILKIQGIISRTTDSCMP